MVFFSDYPLGAAIRSLHSWARIRRLSRGGLLQTLRSVQLLPIYFIFKRMNYVMSSSSYRQDWCNLPDVILGDIMMMVGLESLDTLHTCRQVRRSWNGMIVRNTIFLSIIKSSISVRDYGHTKIQEKCGQENKNQMDRWQIPSIQCRDFSHFTSQILR